MISGYPNSVISDPEFYLTQVVSVFTEFPLELVRRAVMPTGIPADCSTFLPTVGIISNWLRKHDQGSDHDRGQQAIAETRFMLQKMQENDPKTEDELKRRKHVAQSWLDRVDPRAQELSGKKTGVQLKAEARSRLEAQFGIDLIDATPDA